MILRALHSIWVLIVGARSTMSKKNTQVGRTQDVRRCMLFKFSVFVPIIFTVIRSPMYCKHGTSTLTPIGQLILSIISLLLPSLTTKLLLGSPHMLEPRVQDDNQAHALRKGIQHIYRFLLWKIWSLKRSRIQMYVSLESCLMGIC